MKRERGEDYLGVAGVWVINFNTSVKLSGKTKYSKRIFNKKPLGGPTAIKINDERS